MKILVVGLYYDCNLGDAVICDCAAQRLRLFFPDAQVDVHDICHRFAFPEVVEIPTMEELRRSKQQLLQHQYESSHTSTDLRLQEEEWTIRYWNVAEHVNTLAQTGYDVVVFAGGQIFMDYLGLFAETFVQGFGKLGTPVIFNACGTGPRYSPGVQKRLSLALMDPCVKLVSCRDDVRLVNRVYMEGRKRAVPTFDPGLHSAEVYGIKKDENATYVGLGMMFTRSVSSTAAAQLWVQLIDQMDRKKIPWKIFVNGSWEDIAFAKYVYSMLENQTGTFEDHFVPAPRRPRELVQMIAGFRSLISFRLHSHVIAASLDIPSVALFWDPKVKFFFKKIKHPERCCYVTTRPAVILKRLEKAEKKGYNRSLLERQKQYADKLLYRAIQDATSL